MSVVWAPWAERTLVLTTTPAFSSNGGPKLVLHSMECGGQDQCCWPTYGYGAGTPHFSACPLTGWRQHIPMDRSARTLKSPGRPRSPNINGGRVVIQIEACGRAQHIENYSGDWYEAFSEKVAEICEWHGIPREFPFQFGYSSTAYRVSWDAYYRAAGIVAHQNVPYNDHWDAPFNQAFMLDYLNPPTPPKPDPEWATYTVKSGDSLWSIATKVYRDGTKWSVIADANGIPRNDPTIQPGQVLVLPGITTPAPTPPPTPPPPNVPPDWMGPWPYPADHYFGPPPASGYRSPSRVHNGMTDPVARKHVENVRRTLRHRGWTLVAPTGFYNGPPPPQSPCAYGFSEEICKFQRSVMGTSGDGYLGPKTWEAIRKTPIT